MKPNKPLSGGSGPGSYDPHSGESFLARPFLLSLCYLFFSRLVPVGGAWQDLASKRRLGVRKIPYNACPFILGVGGGAGAGRSRRGIGRERGGEKFEIGAEDDG